MADYDCIFTGKLYENDYDKFEKINYRKHKLVDLQTAEVLNTDTLVTTQLAAVTSQLAALNGKIEELKRQIEELAAKQPPARLIRKL